MKYYVLIWDLHNTETCQEACSVTLKYEMNREKPIWHHTKLSYASSSKAIVLMPHPKLLDKTRWYGGLQSIYNILLVFILILKHSTISATMREASNPIWQYAWMVQVAFMAITIVIWQVSLTASLMLETFQLVAEPHANMIKWELLTLRKNPIKYVLDPSFKFM